MDTRSAFNTLERAFVVVVLLLSTGALLPLLNKEGRTVVSAAQVVDVAQGDPVTQIVWLGIYGVTVILAIMRWRQIIYVITRDKLLLALVGIAVISILWSVVPELTLRRGVALGGTTLFAAYVAARYSMSELLRLLAWALGIAALLSLLFALALPSYGIYIDPRGEAWAGIYWHKNTLGRTMALGAIVFLFLALGDRKYRWITLAFCGLSVAILLFSESATSLATFLILLMLWPLYRTLRWRSATAVPFYVMAALGGGLVVAWLLVGNLEGLFGVLGRDSTLSGRTQLWSVVLERILERPWFGYGYGAFWLGWKGESAHVLLRMLGQGIGGNYGAADNGFLDLWLQLGLGGVVVFILCFGRAFFRAVTWVRQTTTTEGLWPLVLLTYILFYNSTESAILAYNNILWVLYVAALLAIAVPLDRAVKSNLTGATPVGGTNRKQPEQVLQRS